jgi:hypothetical protein
MAATDQMDATASGTSALMAVNGLNYGANDTSMSVVSSRKYKSFFSLGTQYTPGQIMQFVLSSGSEYMNARNSYIKFDLSVGPPTGTNASYPVTFGVGKSACNLFSEMVLVHSSGAEIDRTQDLATWCAHRNHWDKSSDWQNSIGSAMGLSNVSNTNTIIGLNSTSSAALGFDALNTVEVKTGGGLGASIEIAQAGGAALPQPTDVWRVGDTVRVDGRDFIIEGLTGNTTIHNIQIEEIATAVAAAQIGTLEVSRLRTSAHADDQLGTFVDSDAKTFIIPLSQVSDIFDQNGQLLPNYLIAGSRLDLTLNQGTVAMYCNNKDGNIVNGQIPYIISKAEIVLDLYTLVDSVVRQLSAISATSGLSIDFSGYWHNASTLTSGDVNAAINISKALSQANAVHVIIRDADKVNPGDTAMARDSFDTVPYANVSNWQFVLGSQFIPQQPVDNLHESFIQTQAAWLKLDQSLPNDVDLVLKYADASVTDTGGSFPVSAFTDYGSKASIKTGIISLTMERNQMLTNSGQAISAQRGLQTLVNMSSNSTTRLFTLFIDYLRLVDVFTDQITVRL